MSDTISVLIKNQVAYITLNRPDKRNALTNSMILALTSELKKLTNHTDVKIVLLQASGKDFCAGADILSMQTMANANLDENYTDAQQLADLLLTLYLFPKPTIAIVQGAARGGGLGLIAACDIAIAEEQATFAFSEVKIGLTPSTISPYIIAAIGERRAHYYFLTGKTFDVYDAHHAGLIHCIATAHQLTECRDDLIQQLLANSPYALKAVKELIRSITHTKISPVLAQHTAEHLSEIRHSKEAKEGLLSFMEKRKPMWSK